MADNKENLKSVLGSKRLLPIIIMLAALAVIVVLSFQHLPIYLFVLEVVVFAGLAVVTIYGQLSSTETVEAGAPMNKQLEAVLNNSSEGIILYTPDFEIMNLNPAAERILNVDAGSITGKQISPEMIKRNDTRLLTQVIFPSLAPVVNKVSSEGWPQVIEITTETPHKKLMTTVDRLRKNGQVFAFIKIIKDKTREEQMLESKTDFITTSAHQLRTPLNGISWALETLAKSLENQDDLKEIAQDGLSLSNRALKIINDLLAVSEIEEGSFGIDLKKVSLSDLIEESMSEAKPIAKQYGIGLGFDTPTQNFVVEVDPDRIKVVISTLLENAITYNSEGGSVNINIQRVSDRPAVRVSIQDTGIGISEEDMKNLFEKFHRGEQAQRIQPNGSGLGLYIAKNIVEGHGGSIWAESTKNRGSTFYFTLPLAS